MKAIETHYKGYRFRSRIEARYAVFFDALGIEWQYEVEGFNLDDGDYYLPDFWLPSFDRYIEIKGQPPTPKEIRLCRKLQFHTEKQIAICHGLPNENYTMLFSWGDDNGG